MEELDQMWAKKEAFDMEKEKKKEERFMGSLELEKKRLALDEKKVESNLMEKEDKIMAMDITNLTSTTRRCSRRSLLVVCRIRISSCHFISIANYFLIQ